MDRNRTKPGETIFAGLLVAGSAYMLWQAWLISGFEAKSSPGAFPMAAAGTMLITSFMVFVRALKARRARDIEFIADVFPWRVMVLTAMIAAYAVALKPIGFLPTSLVFLTLTVRFLHRTSWLRSLALASLCLAIVYVVFRLVFSVLMPEGIVPEREILAIFRNLLSGGAD